MEGTTDFEKLLFLYKTEGRNMTIQTFCMNNGVNYRTLDKCYRNCHKDIIPVQIVEKPNKEPQVIHKEKPYHNTPIAVNLS